MGNVKSADVAKELEKQTGRVIFITPSKEKDMDPDVKSRLKRSDVKVLYESELLKIMGNGEVEKVLVNDLDEDQEYELFVDVVGNPEVALLSRWETLRLFLPVFACKGAITRPLEEPDCLKAEWGGIRRFRSSPLGIIKVIQIKKLH